MPYQMFRLSLMSRRRLPLLEPLYEQSAAPTRTQYLKEAFSRRVDFVYRKSTYSYVHVTDIDSVVSGRMGRQTKERRTTGPDTAFEITEEISHIATNVFVDTDGDPTGQKMAVQLNARVGTPGALLEKLMQAINDANPDGAWSIEVHPMTDEKSFWNVVAEHKQIITCVQFKLVAPNVLGFFDSVSNELREIRDENNGANVGISIENKDGIILDTQSIKNAVRYVSEGGGDAILRARKKILFDSRRNQRSISPPEDAVVSLGIHGVLVSIKKALFGK